MRLKYLLITPLLLISLSVFAVTLQADKSVSYDWVSSSANSAQVTGTLLGTGKTNTTLMPATFTWLHQIYKVNFIPSSSGTLACQAGTILVWRGGREVQYALECRVSIHHASGTINESQWGQQSQAGFGTGCGGKKCRFTGFEISLRIPPDAQVYPLSSGDLKGSFSLTNKEVNWSASIYVPATTKSYKLDTSITLPDTVNLKQNQVTPVYYTFSAPNVSNTITGIPNQNDMPSSNVKLTIGPIQSGTTALYVQPDETSSWHDLSRSITMTVVKSSMLNFKGTNAKPGNVALSVPIVFEIQ
ncbi:adhesin [Escherichia coli]|uniref:adhesin n=1 Tax=Escherichia coli TaxID=562 RepID=UPI00358DA637